jgi:hypothetical protein
MSIPTFNIDATASSIKNLYVEGFFDCSGNTLLRGNLILNTSTISLGQGTSVGSNSVSIGLNAGNISSNESISIGKDAGKLYSGIQNISIGTNQSIINTGTNNIFIGSGSVPSTSSTVSNSVAIGNNAKTNFSNSVAIGANAITTAPGQLVISNGSSNNAIFQNGFSEIAINGNTSIEMATTTDFNYIDFHTSNIKRDYDARIYVGSNNDNINGGADIYMYANSVRLNGELYVKNIMMSYIPTTLITDNANEFNTKVCIGTTTDPKLPAAALLKYTYSVIGNTVKYHFMASTKGAGINGSGIYLYRIDPRFIPDESVIYIRIYPVDSRYPGFLVELSIVGSWSANQSGVKSDSSQPCYIVRYTNPSTTLTEYYIINRLSNGNNITGSGLYGYGTTTNSMRNFNVSFPFVITY